MPTITANPATHILDFGPGHASGIGALTHRNVDGSGIQVILAGTIEAPVSHLQARRQLFGSHVSSVKYGVNWGVKYQPGLVLNQADGKIYVDTSFSRLLGKQPVMVAGMTPSTVDGDFVAACINAGYHIELAGGGHLNENALRDKVKHISSKVPPGSGISLNVLFINQRQWGFQFPLAQVLRKEGIPVDGFTVAAGVPSLELATEIIKSLLAVGIRHVSFKPGSVEGIMQVVTIAKHNPQCPIVLQWTGGRAGGHHSYEDFFQPILDTYSAIRSCENIYLVAGSGFGDGEGTFPYIDGSWSHQFNYPSMPFDGILLGSRMMVAKEGKASESVKKVISLVAGVAEEKDWVNSYKGPAGGIMTVISELGEPIHKIATRGVVLWKELDETVFKLPKEKRVEFLLKNKTRIIKRLNDDSHKVWFGMNHTGAAVDLDEMTYQEVLYRMADLLYVGHQKRWIDKSYRKLFFDFAQRAEERLVRTPVSSCIPSDIDLTLNPDIDPHEFLVHIKKNAALDLNQLLCSDDRLFFIALCRRPGQKPVPFVPLFDDQFETWFKKDSLWQSEDIDAVSNQDPQRVCILQGPVAVRHCKTVNEPAKSILDGITDFHVKQILKSKYFGKTENVPKVTWFGTLAEHSSSVDFSALGAIVEERSVGKTISIPSESTLVDREEWYKCLGGGQKTWISALLLSNGILQGKNVVQNTVRSLFAPRAGHSYQIDNCDEPKIINVLSNGKTLVNASFKGDIINLGISYHGSQGPSILELQFKFVPACPNYPIHEVMEGRNDTIKRFYWKLWFRDEPEKEFNSTLALDPLSALFKSSSNVASNLAAKFCRIVCNHAAAYSDISAAAQIAPMDFAIVVSWKSVIKCLFPAQIDGDLLKLVHLSNQISYLDKAEPLSVGQVVNSEAHISSIKWTPTGKIVEVEAVAHVSGKAVLKVISKFMYRGVFDKNDLYFEKGSALRKKLMIATNEDLAVFRSKNWINWLTDKSTDQVKIGSTLVLELDYFHLHDVAKNVLKTIECQGKILLKTDTKEYSTIGSVEFQSTEAMKANPILHFLDRHSHPLEVPTMFENAIPIAESSEMMLTTSSTNQMYSDISGDHNPIHTDPLLADLAALPGTITHGMWTSAAVRAVVETYAAENQPLRVRDYEAVFDDMILPNDKLQVRLYHVGMKNGRKLIKIETVNQQDVVVMHGVAEVDQPRTAYVFTGQGSQEVGMGMDLYQSSKIAKEIWDLADNHFFIKYGFSIIDMVRNNPKSFTVHFGGPRGQQIKSHYQSMTYETVDANGNSKSVALFPEISDSSTSYTFTSPNGLLFATQFTQPALTLMEKAAYEDMRQRGLAGSACSFAGHSLGEYAALASVGDVLSIETLCDIVFYRGLTMQVAVDRDAQGRSNYGMVAVNPTRVGAGFDDSALRELVPLIGNTCDKILEIVNYNVENWQYVVAGDLEALETLASVLNYISSQKFDIHKLMSEMSREKIQENLQLMTKEAFKRTAARKKVNGFLTLERGIATIPLAGIDVPFHSSYLLNGVKSFRKCLESNIKTVSVDPNILRGQYVPNLTGVPFDTSLEYIHIVLERCDSPVLKNIVKNWKNSTKSAAELQILAQTILIELLAYQFASPVRWIETQDVLFKFFAIERLIEIGPTPVLSGMAERTLKIKYQEYDDALNQSRTLWSYSKHKSEIYYEYSPKVESTPVCATGPNPACFKVNKESTSVPTFKAGEATAVKEEPKVSNAARPTLSAPSKRYDELPFEAEELIRIIVALKTKKALEEIVPLKSIKDLSGGKSTLQNEILADLQKEFGDHVPDRSEELSIKDLGAHIKPVFTKQPGRFTATLLAKMFTSKMPAGFTAATSKDLLDKEFGLGPKAAEQPATRFSSEDAAKSWLREMAAKFFASHQLEMPTGGGQSGQQETSVISSAELEKLQSKHKRLMRQQIELFANYVEQNLLEFQNSVLDKSEQIVALQRDLDLWLAEFGQGFQDGIKPMFSSLKARRYDSFWNWARQDVFMLYYDIIFGRLVNVDRDVTAKCLHVMNRSSQELVDFMEYHIFKSPKVINEDVTVESYQLLRQYGEMLVNQVKESLNRPPMYKDVSIHTRPQVQISYDGSIDFSEIRRSGVGSFDAYVKEIQQGSELLHQSRPDGKREPLLFIREKSQQDHNQWVFSDKKTKIYMDTITDMAVNGVSYEGKTALLTGCGKGSIGCEILKGLLSGGAKVIVTTSSFTRTTVDYFRSIYESHGARSSCLIVVPFNQASHQDIGSLVDYIYSSDGNKGLGWDLDYVVPFAAISENGREMTDLDYKSELAHRIMLTNVLRLAGLITKAKKDRRIESRPAQVVLPLSANHGIFGGDGLYGESKLGLETLFNRWNSEGWKDYLSIVGAVIGWTRGTGLMNDNNLIAEAMERAGLRTFSSNEMAFNILGLMHPKMVRMSEDEPVYGDLNGGLDIIKDLAKFTNDLRQNIIDGAQIRRALAKERLIETSLEINPVERVPTVIPRANLEFKYPALSKPSNDKIFADLLDLSRVIVVTGFSEVGPWGNSRTRWEMESEGELSLEGCIEMAWIMGLIKYHNGVDKDGKHYTGWVDAKTGESVQEYNVKSKYEGHILEHSGIRFVEPELFDGYDPNKKNLCQEIVIDYDMVPFEASKEEADQFKLMHGDKVDVYRNENDSWNIKLRRGATIYVPKALRFDRLVAGQIPTGWSPERYGIPKDIITQVDPITLYTLVATVEALVSAGITDPYEFYQYVHISEVGNTSGGGEGGMLSNRGIFLNRFLDKPVQADMLQECFINTMPAWVNLLILSSSGPIKTPVGACATAVESVEIGVQTILDGKAKVVIVGGYDDFQEESSYEFAQMKATSNSVDELEKGRQPDEMSRPTATSRGGFMESQGAGIQVLMTAELALQMGCPIYGIVALTNTATDKEGRSVPAPGQGILTTARSVRPQGYKPRILEASYRHGQLLKAQQKIKEWLAEEVKLLQDEAEGIENEAERKLFMSSRAKDIELEAVRREKNEKLLWGFDFWKQDSRISPIEGALATFGLDIDDIGVASFHGTGTKANDSNESDVVNQQLKHLGRTKGNLIPCVFQKYLTGHPKGAAAAWMMNGALQILNTGIIPGNRNADNIDEKLNGFNYLLFLSRTIRTTGVRAAILKSFGFGQVGGEVLLVHPEYLFRAVEDSTLKIYSEKRQNRQSKTFKYLQDSLIGVSTIVQVKNEPPYSAELESKVYLNPAARAEFDFNKNSWRFKATSIEKCQSEVIYDIKPDGINSLVQSSLSNGHDVAGVGIDVQAIIEVNIEDEAFLDRNFTPKEREYCNKQPDVRASYSGRWAGKESIIKALCNASNNEKPDWLKGPGGDLAGIEILPDATGAPAVSFVGNLAGKITSSNLKVSISHSGAYAIAIAVVGKKQV